MWMIREKIIAANRVTTLAMVALLGSIVLFPSPVHAAQGNQGLQGGWAVDNSGNIDFTHSLSRQFSSLQQAGAGWVRINFRLGSCFTD